MSWKREMRKAGIPNRVKDATWRKHGPLEFEIPDDPLFFGGCVIGDACNCTAAKAIKGLEGVLWTWVGASKAIVVFADGRQLRYQHSGVIPKMQDRLMMPPPGVYRLNPPRPSVRLGRNRTGTGEKGKVPQRGITYSAAALLRR